MSKEFPFRWPAGIQWQSLLCEHHQSPLRHCHWFGLYSGLVHVWPRMDPGAEKSRSRGSTQLSLTMFLQWGEQSRSLLHCCVVSWWLSCSANAATIPLGKFHRSRTSRQQGDQRQGLLLGQSPYRLDSHWGCSCPAQDQGLTKTPQIELSNCLLWPGSLQGINGSYTKPSI